MPELTIGPQETHRDITLKLGEALTVRLEENPTTGFRWAALPAQDDVLELQSATFSAGINTGIGAGGERLFVFKAKASGSASVKLVLRQEWLPENPARQVLLNIVVS